MFLLIVLAIYSGALLIDGNARWQKFQFADLRARALALYDSEGRYFGIVHPETENDHLGEFERVDLSPLDAAPDHKAVPMAEAPPYFWRCVVFTEDRHRGEWRNRNGVDVLNLARLPVSSRGGSTLEMQLARSMWKMHSRNSSPVAHAAGVERGACAEPVPRAGRGYERAGALVLAAYPAGAGGGEDEQGSLCGVYPAGQFLFGKRLEDLDPAEQLVLAAAVRRPVAWPADEERRANIVYDLIGVEEDRRRALLCAGDDARLADGKPVRREGMCSAVDVAR